MQNNQSRLTKTIIGAVIAVALAVDVSYGLISQQTADKIQTQANQSLQAGSGTAGQGVPPTPTGQPAPTPQNPSPQASPQTVPNPMNPAPAPTSAPRQ